MRLRWRPYSQHDPLVPVHIVTPPDGIFIHTFYDVCPWSPSGRYLLALRLPYQDREPAPGDKAHLCLIDLVERKFEVVCSTSAWATQAAAHQTWGSTDEYVYFNDVLDGIPVGVRLDLATGARRYLEGPFYVIAPDERYALAPTMVGAINRIMPGYGVAVDAGAESRLAPSSPEEDGLWRIDLETGKRSLLLSLDQIRGHLRGIAELDGARLHGFRVMINPQQTRVMMIVLADTPGRKTAVLITCKPDGSDVTIPVTPKRWEGGHHPNWHPDGERIVMNLMDPSGALRFYQFKYDGTEWRVLAPGSYGSGHPSLHKDGRWLVTDAYPQERVCRNDWVPIRAVDVEEDRERAICWVWTLGRNLRALRVDPHPVWSRDWTHICFTAAPEGKRQLMIADLSEIEALFEAGGRKQS